MSLFADLVKIVSAPVQVAVAVVSVPVRLLAEPLHEVAQAAEALADDVKRALK